MAQFRDCVIEIRRAITSDYPSNLEYKLRRRRALSMAHLAEYTQEEIEKEFNAALKSSRDNNQEEWASKIIKDMKRLKTANNPTDTNRVSKVRKHKVPILPTTQLLLDNDQDNERCLIASTVLDCGDVLIDESPIARVLDECQSDSRCEACLSGLGVIPIP